MGSNPGELLGAQDGQPSFSSTSVSSSCLTKFFLKFGSLGIGRIYWQIYFFKIVVVGHQIFKTDWFWNGDVPKTMNQSFGNPAMKYSVQILPQNRYNSQLVWSFSTLTKQPRLVSSRLGPSDGLVPQATGKRLDAYRRTNKQEDVQPYESGIDGALPQ